MSFTWVEDPTITTSTSIKTAQITEIQDNVSYVDENLANLADQVTQYDTHYPGHDDNEHKTHYDGHEGTYYPSHKDGILGTHYGSDDNTKYSINYPSSDYSDEGSYYSGHKGVDYTPQTPGAYVTVNPIWNIPPT